jgi:hypothetical protein
MPVPLTANDAYNPFIAIAHKYYLAMINQNRQLTPKLSHKSLQQQIDVVAEFHAHKISPERIAYRTGIDLNLVIALINGESHQRLFTKLLGLHRKSRRDQRLKKSLRHKGIGQAMMQDQIEKEYLDSIERKTKN